MKKFFTLLMAIGLISTTGYSQFTVIQPGNSCAAAVDITANMGYQQGRLTAIAGNNFAGTTTAAPGCWASTADRSVWYRVDLVGGSTYTFSTDNGINDFAGDYQMALYNGCGGTLVACSEDLLGETESNQTLSAGFTVLAAATGTYYLQIDVFGTDTSWFTLTVYQNGKTVNDQFGQAIDITSVYNGTNTFNVSGWYAYNDFAYTDNENTPSFYNADSIDEADEPTWDVTSGDRNNESCGSLVSEQNGGIRHDVWFKFDFTPSNTNGFVSVYPMNGWPILQLELYQIKVDASQTPPTVDTVFLGCAVPDGLVSGRGYSDTLNFSINNFTSHPRIGIPFLPTSDTYYLRVSQYVRASSNSDDSLVAPPSEGFFNIVFERRADCLLADGAGADNSCCPGNTFDLNCDDSAAPVNGTNVSKTFPNLSNSGSQGGISAVQGGTAVPGGRANEPGDFTVAGGSTRIDFNCTGEELIDATTRNQFNNNSVYYKFTVSDSIRNVMLPDTIIDVFIFDSLITIPANSIAPGVPPTSVVLPPADIRLLLETCAGVTLWNDTSATPLVDRQDPLNIFSTLVCTNITTLCGADVKFSFNNLGYVGVNGALAEFYVVPADPNCGDPASPGNAVFGSVPNSVFDSCFAMGPSSFYLPGGTYYLVVDGESGSLAGYDLSVDINYFVPGTIVPCGMDCGDNSASSNQNAANTLSVSNLNGLDVRPLYVAPVPAIERVEIAFASSNSGPMDYVIVDLNGRIAQSGTIEVVQGANKHQFDIAGYEAGVYFIALKMNGTTTQMKFLKQ